MNIHLCDFDGKMPNLALMRLSTYYKQRGASVQLVRGPQSSRLFDSPDKMFLSCIFRWNHDKALETQYQMDGRCTSGGTGIDIGGKLPADVEESQLDYTLYPECNYAIGFISRGCIRKCPWCVVPLKEGGMNRVSTAKEIVGSRRRAVFLDNNFLALPDFDRDLAWLSQNGITIDFNQALDARLIDQSAARLLARCSWYPSIRISLDSDGMMDSVHRAINYLADAGMHKGSIRVFVLIGFNGLESDVRRLVALHEWGVAPFPMGYRDNNTGEEPAIGWDTTLYKKYRRLICRIPMAKSVWDSFQAELLP